MLEETLARAAEVIGGADALFVTAGAGMGVDSGLPDFRGDQGFWKAYPPYAKLGLSFVDMANPTWFRRDPELAWGFYGHRLGLYRSTTPHAGFAILRGWMERAPSSGFVFTSNVDGAFQRASFDESRIVECHGAIDWVQCTAACGAGVTRADGITVDVDETTFRARPPLPKCDRCGKLLRPNVLMFGDGEWDDAREVEQSARLRAWLETIEREKVRVAVIECGAGKAIPTVRMAGERIAQLTRGTLVRINVREPEVPRGHLGISLGAREALERIAAW